LRTHQYPNMKNFIKILFLSALLLSVTISSAQKREHTDNKQVVPIAGIHTPIDHKDQSVSLSTDTLSITPKKKGFLRRIIDYYNRSNVDRTFEKKIDWSIAPGPNYSSDVGFGIGFLIAGLYRLDRTDSITAPSNVSIYGNVTTEKFFLLRFSGDNIFNHNKQRLSYSGAFVYFPGAFYGIGHKAGEEGYAQDLTTTMGIARISYCSAVVGRLYLGVSAELNYSGSKYKKTGVSSTRFEKIKDDVDNGKENPLTGDFRKVYDTWAEDVANGVSKENLRYDPDKQDPFSNYFNDPAHPERVSEKANAFNTNIGLFAQYDTRDLTFNASKGIFVKGEVKWYPKWLGNTGRHFGRFALTFDAYQKLWKGAILAYDLYTDIVFGTPSWHMYAKLGGMERMRGYYEGRYRDKRLVETQLELRQKIYRRHGIVGWIGAGQVWGTAPFNWGNTLYSFGCGYRFEFKKRMNIRLDYGWGVYGNQHLPWDRKRSSAFMFTASEAF